MEITDEMRVYSQNRTQKHIDRVIALGATAGYDFTNHDNTKFSDELNDAYVLIDNSYRTDLLPPVPYTDEMANASFKHITRESHHPEYWDNTVTQNYKADMLGSDTDTIVNAAAMPNKAIVEMCCDWIAMSMEFGNDIFEWAEENIPRKWKFTLTQRLMIDFTLTHLSKIAYKIEEDLSK